MRTPTTLVLLATLAAAAAPARALPSDVKTLAQFDLGFARCEARYAHMKGKTDEAYLGLWKVKVDAARRAELAKVRKGADYKREREAALKGLAPETAELEPTIRAQCEGTWAEALRNAPLAKPVKK